MLTNCVVYNGTNSPHKSHCINHIALLLFQVKAGNRAVSTSDKREQRHYGIVRIWKVQRGASAEEEGEREALGFHEAKIIAHVADHGTTFTLEFKKLQKKDSDAPVTKQRYEANPTGILLP